MKKIIFLTSFFCMFFGVQANAAQLKPYLSLKLGASFSEGKADEGKEDFEHSLTDIAWGAKISDSVRAELAFAYRAENKKTTKAQTGSLFYKEKDTVSGWTFGINGYYDIQTKTKLKPYVGAGIGLAKMTFDLQMNAFDGLDYYWLDESYSKVSFAWNIGTGFTYEIDNKTALDIGYRYSDFGSFKKDGVKFEMHANEVMVGIRYSF